MQHSRDVAKTSFSSKLCSQVFVPLYASVAGLASSWELKSPYEVNIFFWIVDSIEIDLILHITWKNKNAQAWYELIFNIDITSSIYQNIENIKGNLGQVASNLLINNFSHTSHIIHKNI
jgi:hypothetical protein